MLSVAAATAYAPPVCVARHHNCIGGNIAIGSPAWNIYMMSDGAVSDVEEQTVADVETEPEATAFTPDRLARKVDAGPSNTLHEVIPASPARPHQAHAPFESRCDGAVTWQAELEKILSPRTSSEDRQMLLRDLLSRGPEISEEVSQAIENGDFASLAGDSELVSDLDNVRRQILDDLLPDATNLLADPERLAEEAQGFAAAAPSIAQDARKRRRAWRRLGALLAIERPSSRGGALVQREASNVFSRTPEGLAIARRYRVLKSGDGYELREYAAVDVVRTDVAVSAGGGASSGSTSVQPVSPGDCVVQCAPIHLLPGRQRQRSRRWTSRLPSASTSRLRRRPPKSVALRCLSCSRVG